MNSITAMFTTEAQRSRRTAGKRGGVSFIQSREGMRAALSIYTGKKWMYNLFEALQSEDRKNGIYYAQRHT